MLTWVPMSEVVPYAWTPATLKCSTFILHIHRQTNAHKAGKKQKIIINKKDPIPTLSHR